MKRISILFAVALLLGACTRNKATGPLGPVSVDFHHSGCLKETKADRNDPTLTLEYTDDGLLITSTNVRLSCGGDDDITFELSVQEDIIHYRTYSTSYANCVCPYNLTALVSGLQEDAEYTLEYSSEHVGNYRPITFYYAPGLDVTFDLRLYTMCVD